MEYVFKKDLSVELDMLDIYTWIGKNIVRQAGRTVVLWPNHR